VAHEHRLAQRFTAAHPHVGVVEVTARPGDVHDLDGLRDVATELTAEQLARSGAPSRQTP
jgi:hypothetical protein